MLQEEEEVLVVVGDQQHTNDPPPAPGCLLLVDYEQELQEAPERGSSSALVLATAILYHDRYGPTSSLGPHVWNSSTDQLDRADGSASWGRFDRQLLLVL